jgi:alpha-tubulin suppressor-like RCC1 family protein
MLSEDTIPFDAIPYPTYNVLTPFDKTASLVTVYPTEQIQSDILWRLSPSSIESYNVIDATYHMTFCSQVSYLNLKRITGLPDTSFKRGDAIEVWKSTTWAIYSGSLSSHLYENYYTTKSTIFDIVTYQSRNVNQKDTFSEDYIRQSHRFVVFLWTDDKRYVIDPVRTPSTWSLELQYYEKNYRFERELYKIVRGYIPSSQWKMNEKDLEIKSTSDFLSYSYQWITELKRSSLKKELDVLLVHHPVIYTYNNIKASLWEWLELATADGKKLELSRFTLDILPTKKNTIKRAITTYESSVLPAKVIIDGKTSLVSMKVSDTKSLPSSQLKKSTKPQSEPTINSTSPIEPTITTTEYQFQFGISWQHLKFSEPVELRYKIDLPDWSLVSLWVKHGSDTVFSTEWLSTYATTQCHDGQATVPWSQAIVQSWEVVFYTCGASTFSLTYTGGANSAHFVDAGFKDFTLSFLTWIQFPTGTTMSDVDISIDWMPIDNESPTGPRWTTNCFPGEKSFQLYHPDGAVVNLINAGQLTTPNTSCPRVMTTFDDQTLNPAITTTYVTGTYKPTAGQSLGSFNNKSPFGDWKLRMTDSAWADGVILFWFTLILTTNPDIRNNSGNAMTLYYPEQSNTSLIDIVTFDPTYSEWSGLTYTLSGVDASQFSINASGIVTWINQPRYDIPTDNDSNNIYDLKVVVTNGIGNTDTIDLAVTVVRAVGQSCQSQVDLATANTCMTTTGWTVRCRWLNTSRQVADGTTTQRLIPTNSTLFGSNIMQVDAAQTATFVVSITGQVRAIGANTNGQLGDGTTTARTTPVNIMTGVLRIYNTQLHTCALMTDATVKCRWRNANGQVGDNTIVQKLVPTSVVGLTGVADIALQSVSSCALMTNGTVKCRWSNANGRLGDNTTTQRLTPVGVVGLTGVQKIVAGAWHMCALKNNGTVRCRWLNTNGQLWDNTITQRLIPTAVAGWLTGVVSLAASTSSTCALKSDGTIRCRWLNTNGRLGDNTTTQRLIPTAVVGMTWWSAHQIFGSASVWWHFCASSMSWSLYCRWLNSNGQLWDNTITQRLIPTLVSGGNMIDVNRLCPINTYPVIQNNSGATISTGYIEDETVLIVDINTIDTANSEWNGLVYSLTWADKLLFSINGSGIVNRISSPDYDVPGDVWWDNIYNITVTVTNSLGFSDTIDLIITVSPSTNGQVCIDWPNNFNLGSSVITNSTQTLSLQSDYFKVDDQKGNNSGYYTTVSITTLTGNNWFVIPLSQIQRKADPITLLSGTANTWVVLWSTLSWWYVAASTPAVFIKRDIWPNSNKKWTYWSKLRLKVDIPAYQSIWTYTWVITYTLYQKLILLYYFIISTLLWRNYY